MIIFQNLGLMTHSDMPNTDWTEGEARYTIDDNAELAEKVKAHSPFFKPVEDSDGNLIDIIPLTNLEQKSSSDMGIAEPVDINNIYKNQLLIMEALVELKEAQIK